MATQYQNFVSGTLSVALATGGTTVSASALSGLNVVAAPDTMWMVIDPAGLVGTPEVVQITVHTASATTATVVRAQQGTSSPASWPIGTQFEVAGPTKSDLDELPFRKLTTIGDLLVATAANTASRLPVGAAGRVLGSDGTNPSWRQVDVADLTAAVQALLVPAGTVSATVSASAPTGWLFHNQTSVGAQTAFPALWAVAPASWKSGANLVIPNLTDAFLSQAGTTTLGATGGANTVVITSANLPVHVHDMGHNHVQDPHNHTQNSHNHTVSDPTHTHASTSPDPTTNGDQWGFGGGGLGGWGVASDNASNNNIYHKGPTIAASTGISLVAATATNIAQTATNQAFVGSTGNGGFTNTAIATRPLHLGVNFMIKAH